MSDKIVVTGMGAVTPVGVGVESYWRGITSGECGIDKITAFDTSGLHIDSAAQIRDFRAKDYLPTRLVMDLEPYMQYAYVSAEEAIAQSALDCESERIGIIMGSALSGIDIVGDTQAKYITDGKTAGPKFLTKAMGNLAAGQLAISRGIKGPCMTVSTACSSGGDAITLAKLLLRSGAADAMIVMAGEAAVCPTLIQSLYKTGALSRTGESRPFDKKRNGFVLGEGGGALVLEREDFARSRGARIIARLFGSANCCDAYNPVAPEQSGAGAARCISLALADAGIKPGDIDYINAHGTATLMGDIAESSALRLVFGDMPVSVSSTKGATGHMMGAGGITETIACVKAAETGVMPVNTGFDESDPECPLNIVTNENSLKDVRIAMSNAMGFGGQNSCVIVGKY